jgi:hypothetical protein
MIIFIRTQLADFWETVAVIRNNKRSGMLYVGEGECQSVMITLAEW